MNLPLDFKTYIREVLSQQEEEILFNALENETEIVAIRLNKNKATLKTDIDQLGLNSKESVPWCDTGIYLSSRPIFTLCPLFHAGAYYVQDPSTMYIDIVVEAIKENYSTTHNSTNFWNNSLKVLDLCAAPGGKSTHLLSKLNSNSILVSNEVIKTRSSILAENIAKWGYDNAIVTNNDPSDFKLNEYFNLIVVDAPCSGEGMFRKEPKALEQWSKENVEICAARQQRILRDIWTNLENNGYLVYSTCTFNKHENDNTVQYIIDELGAELVKINNIPKGVLQSPIGALQFIPGFIKGEGQYLAILRKNSKSIDKQGINKYNKSTSLKIQKEVKPSKDLKNLPYLPKDYQANLIGELVKIYPNNLVNDIKYIESKMRVVLSGRIVASLKGKDFVPYADLAFSKELDSMNINKVEVSKEIALQFLAKEAITLNNSPLGYLLLTYKNYGIGFVKNLGNRCNNLLPTVRRIRMNIK